jgi:hypothetical protein
VQHAVTVNPLPDVNIFATKSAVCEGQSVSLTAFGANTYLWTNNATTNVITVNPTSTTNYQVYGTNSFGCQAMAQQQITVHPNPSITGAPDRAQICVGEAVYLSASGGVSYQWVSPNSFMQSNPAVAYPTASTNYTLTGKNAFGCTASQVVPVAVDACTGLSEQSGGKGLKVFPNPNAGIFTVQVAGKAEVAVSDLSGRLVASASGENLMEINISSLANGIYTLKVVTSAGSDVIRIIKD